MIQQDFQYTADIRASMEKEIADVTMLTASPSRMINVGNRGARLAHAVKRQEDVIAAMERQNQERRIFFEFQKGRKDDAIASCVVEAQEDMMRAGLPVLHSTLVHTDVPQELPSTIKEIASSFSELSGLSACGIALLCCQAVAMAVRGTTAVTLDAEWREKIVEMALHVAPSGSMKSKIASLMTEPFLAFQRKYNALDVSEAQLQKEYNRQLDRYSKRIESVEMKDVLACQDEAVRLKMLRDMAEHRTQILSGRKKRQKLRLFIDHVTSAGLEKVLQEQDECIAIFSTEGDFLTSKRFTSSSGPEILKKSHAGESFLSLDFHKSVELDSPTVNLVNFMQPGIAQKLYSNHHFAEDGLLARFIPYFYTEQQPNGRHDISQGKAFYNATIQVLLEASQTLRRQKLELVLSASQDAYVLLKNFEAELAARADYPKKMEGFVAKAHGQAARFATEINLWKQAAQGGPLNAIQLDRDDAQAGIALMRCALDHAQYAFDSSGLMAHENAVKILASLWNIAPEFRVEFLQEGISSRTLQIRTGIHAKEIGDAFNNLCYGNFARVIDFGHSEIRLALHPDFYNEHLWNMLMRQE